MHVRKSWNHFVLARKSPFDIAKILGQDAVEDLVLLAATTSGIEDKKIFQAYATQANALAATAIVKPLAKGETKQSLRDIAIKAVEAIGNPQKLLTVCMQRHLGIQMAADVALATVGSAAAASEGAVTPAPAQGSEPELAMPVAVASVPIKAERN